LARDYVHDLTSSSHVQNRELPTSSNNRKTHDTHCRKCTFSVGEKVFVKNHHRRNKWLLGSIVKETGPISFQVKLKDGRIICCHQGQIKQCFIDNNDDDDVTMFSGTPIP